jgi:hypothetical protein
MRGQRRGSRLVVASASLVVVALDKFDVVGGEEAGLAVGVLAHPPVFVDHVDVGYVLAFTEVDFVVLGFFVVV